jgi:hypothetical protein
VCGCAPADHPRAAPARRPRLPTATMAWAFGRVGAAARPADWLKAGGQAASVSHRDGVVRPRVAHPAPRLRPLAMVPSGDRGPQARRSVWGTCHMRNRRECQLEVPALARQTRSGGCGRLPHSLSLPAYFPEHRCHQRLHLHRQGRQFPGYPYRASQLLSLGLGQMGWQPSAADQLLQSPVPGRHPGRQGVPAQLLLEQNHPLRSCRMHPALLVGQHRLTGQALVPVRCLRTHPRSRGLRWACILGVGKAPKHGRVLRCPLAPAGRPDCLAGHHC